MADFEYNPDTPGYRVGRVNGGPVTLITEYEDGGLTIREKASSTKRLLDGIWTLGQADTKAVMDLFDTKGFDTTLTVLTGDPQAADPDTDSGTFYFHPPAPEPVYAGPDFQRLRIRFREA